MKPVFSYILFAVAGALALFFPIVQISTYSKVKSAGREIRLPVQPRDPYDPFRGRYVRIRFDRDRLTIDEHHHHGWNISQVYATFSEDENGIAYLTGISDEKPQRDDYVVALLRWSGDANKTSIDLPMDRFYLNEDIAPLAEQAYNEAVRNSSGHTCIAVLHIHRGRILMTNVLIDDIPIVEYVKQNVATER